MSTVASVAMPVTNIDGINNSKSVDNINLDQIRNSFHVSEVIEENNPIQCYVNQDNTISFINNGHAFANENGDMFYACITSGNDINQQDQILQLIPQNQLSNYIVSDKEYSTLNFINDSSLINCNQFFNGDLNGNAEKLSASANKQHCVVCDVDFPSKRAFLKHMTIHDNDREFKCSWCKMSYNHEINLLVHVAIIHPNQCSIENDTDLNYRCLVCSLQFKRKKALQGHCLIHQVDEELICEQCSASFNSRVILDRHISDHHNEIDEPIQSNILHCKLCNQTSDNIGYLKRHYKQCHKKIEIWSEDLCEEDKTVKLESDTDQNFDPSCKRRSSKIASQTIKLYAQGKLKSREPGTDTDSKKKRGRPKKIQGSSKHLSKNDVTCTTCQRTFKTPILLRRHEVTHTGIKEFECPICKKKFTQKSSVKIHMVVHDEIKAFNCQICQKSFTYEHNMLTHIRTVHKFDENDKNGTRNHKTIQNDDLYVFGNRGHSVQDTHAVECYLTQANDTSHGYAVYESEPPDTYGILSGTVESMKADLNDGLIQEDGEVSQYLWQENQPTNKPDVVVSSYKENQLKRNSYIPSTPNFTKIDWDKSQTVRENRGILLSEEVDKLDKETGQVQVHEVIHDQITGFKRFRCRFCKKLYRKSGDLSRHVRIHTQQRPFKCYLCHKSFRLKSVLKNHFKSHWKLKEFSCDLCSKSFNLKQTLKVHLRLHNTEQMKFSCDICHKRFNSSYHYKYHNRTQHKESSDIVFLNASQTATTNLKPILLDSEIVQRRQSVPGERPFQCDQCNKSYKLKKYLKDHLKDHNDFESRKMCIYCDKSFTTIRSLQQHSRTQHINRRAFTCSQCPASFILKASLNRHALVHSTLKPYACPLCYRRFKAKIYCDRHIGLQKCTKKSSKLSPNRQNEKKIVKIGSNIESEILSSEQTGGPYCNFRLVDLDMNTSQSSNILVTNYVNEYQDKFMVVSLDGHKTENSQHTEPSQYYMDDRNSAIENCPDNMLGMLENQMGVNSGEIGAIYNYRNNLTDDVGATNLIGYQQQTQQHESAPPPDNIYYYQTISDIEEPIQKGTLADKFPILKATLFSDDEINILDHNKSKINAISSSVHGNTMIYCQDNPSGVHLDLNPASSVEKLFHGCANCHERFSDSETLIRHVKLSHKIPKDFVCHVCHKAFSVQLSLWAHSKIHETVHTDIGTEDFLVCIACSQKFISVPSLSRHVRMQHNDKLNLYRCTHCDTSYKTTRELDSHIKQLNADYDAIIINSQLVNNPNKIEPYQRLPQNMKDHSFCKDFQIELENAEIDEIASLDASKTTKLSMQELIKAAKKKRGVELMSSKKSDSQTNVLDPLLSYPYSCSVCHKGCNRASNLQQHLLVHTKITPYQCLKCNRKFRHRCSLKTHEATKHSAMMKLLRCHLCLKLLRSQTALRNHMKVHLKSYSFNCENCSKKFPTQQEQIRHSKLNQCQLTVSGYDEKPVVTLCDRVTEENGIKLVKCVSCSVAFSSSSEYENHECCTKRWCGKKHLCVLCNETFLSSADLCMHICDVHKTQTKYNCSFCNLLFVQESLLLSHQKAVHNL